LFVVVALLGEMRAVRVRVWGAVPTAETAGER